MIYKDFCGHKLSALGMGGMRFPVLDGDNSKIDIDAVRQMVAYAMEKGVNYYDTAMPYHGGFSEKVLGELLKEYPRDSFYLATKFSGFNTEAHKNVKSIFEGQLERCQVDYFDFYLVHNVNDANIDNYLDLKYGVMDYLVNQKKQGKIKHIGFSVHGTLETLKRFIDAYGEHIEFCQMQLNWLDYKMQNAKAKVEYLKKLNIPIWVMEPVRGGKLANIDAEYQEELRNLRPDAATVEWAFRYLQSIPEVTVTLSGMSNMEQLKENIKTYETENPLTESEIQSLFSIAQRMIAKSALPCTACRYCTDYCKKNLDIPRIIELYNDYVFTGGGFFAPMSINAMPEEKRPTACAGCRACEGVCPQNIKISEMMKDFSERLAKL